MRFRRSIGPDLISGSDKSTGRDNSHHPTDASYGTTRIPGPKEAQ
jgi:hypothetical protein